MRVAADVHAGGRLVGHVARESDRTTFTYAEDYDGQPLVPHLPLGTTTWPAGALPPLLSNLLPEGRRLEALRQQVKTSSDNEVALLLAIGNDLVGDLQFVPPGAQPSGSSAPLLDLDGLDTITFAHLRDLPVSGVPGVQEKVKVSERMSLPVRETAVSTHLLKFGQQGLPRLVANEHTCLQVLADARLDVNEATVVVDATGEEALLVTRFDREVTDGGVTARRQLDGCQATGRYPADKYDLDTVEVVTALAGLCANPTVAALRLLEQVVASYLMGNGDLHAKNLSVYDRGRGLEASPAYDVVFTHPYGDTETMALPIAGEARVARIDRQTFLDAGEQCGVRAAAMDRVIDRLLDRTGDAPERLAAGWPREMEKFRRVLEQRRRRLAA
jgi:serine/threonine-protein kinase HipA